MSFASPVFFWGLLALLPLAAVYFIRTRPRRQQVNAFFLWQKVFKQQPADSLFQKLRNLLSLLLVALAFIAAIFALTRVNFDGGKSTDLLIVIDRSVSMSGMEDGKSRLDRAKDTARSWVAALGGSRRVALADVAGGLEYRVHLTSHSRALIDAIDAMRPSEEALDPQALAGLEIPGGNGKETKTRVLFLTDRRSAPLHLPAGVELVDVGSRPGNVGITAADLRWDGLGKARLFVSLVSDFPAAREVELELVSAADGSIARLFTMKLPANGTADESILVENVEPGNWLLRLRGNDSLAADNTAALGLNAPQPILVRVLAKNRFFFDQCVAAFSRTESLFRPVQGAAHLALAEGTASDEPYAVVFTPSGESPFWENPGAELPGGPAEIIAKDHPLLSHLDPLQLTFEGARKLAAPKGSVIVLAHADGTPLLYTCSTGGRSAVVVNMDPARAEFFLSPWFPVLVHDSAALLTGRKDDFPSTIATGGRVEIPGTGPVEKATLHKEEKTYDLPATSPAAIHRAGNYDFSRNSTLWHLGGAVLSDGESGPAPADKLPAPAPPASGWPPAVWLLLAAILVILTEEFLYHRRKVG